MGDCFCGEALDPGVWIAQCGAKFLGSGICAGAECAEGFDGAVAGRCVGAFETLDEGAEGAFVGAFAEGCGGAFSDEGRPAFESVKKLVGGAFLVLLGIVFEGEVATGGDDFGGLGWVELGGDERFFAGDAEALEGQAEREKVAA